MEISRITILANRLAESILMDWDKEEQIKLAWETAAECNKIITKFHKEQRVVCKESLQTPTLE